MTTPDNLTPILEKMATAIEMLASNKTEEQETEAEFEARLAKEKQEEHDDIHSRLEFEVETAVEKIARLSSEIRRWQDIVDAKVRIVEEKPAQILKTEVVKELVQPTAAPKTRQWELRVLTRTINGLANTIEAFADGKIEWHFEVIRNQGGNMKSIIATREENDGIPG